MLKRMVCVMLPLFLAGKLGAEQIYKSDFNNAVSADVWTFDNIYQVPETDEKILGRILYQASCALHLKELPKHAMVRLRFDLLLFGDIAGDLGEKTYDGFSIGMRGGPLLFTTNFSTGGAANSKTQFYPDEYPGATHPAGTGNIGKDGRHRYHFDMTFPHSADDLSVFFRGRTHNKESGWGFADVSVDVLDKPADLPAGHAAKLWSALAGDDTMAAHRAGWDLIASGDTALKAIDSHWQQELALRKKASSEKAAAAEKTFGAAVAGLDSDSFVERQKATAAINGLGVAALPLIEKSLADQKLATGVHANLKRLKSRVKRKEAAGDPKQRRLESRIAHVRRVLDQSRSGWRVTSSRDENPNGWDGPKATIDGFVPPRSATIICPRFSWYPKNVGDGWLQIDFPKEREISKVGVYWFFAGWGTAAPASWRIEYLDADGTTWKPVSKPGAFGVAPDQFNRVTFDTVKTTAVRIVATFDGKKSTGVHEVEVE